MSLKNILKNTKVDQETDNTWINEFELEEKNRFWLDKSFNIAIQILSKLRSNKKQDLKPSTQKELAKSMGVTPQYVNKLVKGSENLTLETICKIENILGFDILLKEQTEKETKDFKNY